MSKWNFVIFLALAFTSCSTDESGPLSEPTNHSDDTSRSNDSAVFHLQRNVDSTGGRQKSIADQCGELIQRAGQQEERGDFAEAKLTWNQVLKLVRIKYGDDSWQATNARLAVQDVKWRAEMDDRQLEIRRRILQLDAAGQGFLEENEPQRALQAYAEASRLAQQIWIRDSYAVATYLSHEAEAYRVDHQPSVAIDKHRQVLEILQRIVGSHHPDYVATLGTLGELYRQTGRDEEALRIFGRATDLAKTIWGAGDHRHADQLNRQGTVYHAIGDYSSAKEALYTAQKIRQRQLGDDHVAYGESAYNLGAVFFAEGNWQAAIGQFNTALSVYAKRLGGQHEQTLSVMDNLAAARMRQKEYLKAEELLSEIAETRLQLLGEQHPITLRTLFRLAIAFGHQAKYDKAEPLLEHVLAVRETNAAVDDPELKNTFETYAVLLERTGRDAEAKRLLAKYQINVRR